MLSLADPEGLGGYGVLVQRLHAPRPRLAHTDAGGPFGIRLLPAQPAEW